MDNARETLPQFLDAANPQRVLVETLGWQFATWGGLCVFVSVVSLVSDYVAKGPGQTEWWGGAAITAPGLAMLAYEAWRRAHRTALVIEEDAVGIYRGKMLSAQVSRGEIGRFIIEPLNTVRIVIGLGMAGVTAGILSYGLHWLTYRLLAAGATLAIVSALASSIRTRHFCDIYLLPGKKRGVEWFMVPRRQRGKLRG